MRNHETEIVASEACRDIARAAVLIWKQSVGRGADFAQAFAGDYGIAMIFRGILTPLERTTVERGQGEAIAAIRRGVFVENRGRLIEAVERESGRTVETVLYACSPEDDMSAFTFVLAREEGRG